MNLQLPCIRNPRIEYQNTLTSQVRRRMGGVILPRSSTPDRDPQLHPGPYRHALRHLHGHPAPDAPAMGSLQTRVPRGECRAEWESSALESRRQILCNRCFTMLMVLKRIQ